ncbi:hypothetical protein V9T40_014008 [Parthenolecanium corni]|uniref:Uncharacterized protein n=1 Tax=Parthenolecanium corni TaxID=536013 RepID=A0AAN9Y312_9HEMI
METFVPALNIIRVLRNGVPIADLEESGNERIRFRENGGNFDISHFRNSVIGRRLTDMKFLHKRPNQISDRELRMPIAVAASQCANVVVSSSEYRHTETCTAANRAHRLLSQQHRRQSSHAHCGAYR